MGAICTNCRYNEDEKQSEIESHLNEKSVRVSLSLKTDAINLGESTTSHIYKKFEFDTICI
jgi:hypothetical protein